MKKLIPIVSILFFSFVLTSSFAFSTLNLCCDYLYVTTEQTDSCCIAVTLHNPECITPLVKFYQWNSATGEYEVVESVTVNKGETSTHVYCPMNRDSYIKYRLRVVQSNNPDLPMCPGINGVDEFVEGRTQFSDSIDVTSCCVCPQNVDDWLTLVVEKDEENCPNGCKVTPILNIPDSITCYKYYSVATSPNFDLSPIRPLSQLSTEWKCVGYDETIEYDIALLQSNDVDVESEWYNLCTIEKTSEPCDSCPCPPSASDWLHVVVEKNNACPDGCQVAMQLNIPEEYSCYQYYQLLRPDNTMLPIKNIDNDPIENQTFCMDENTTGNIKVALMKYPMANWDSACVIIHPVTCDSNTTNLDSLSRPCNPDCPDSTWENANIEITLPSGCKVRVYYRFRIACNPLNYQDIQILRIEMIMNCNGIGYRQIFKETFIKLIEINQMGFNPLPGDTLCYDTWRLVNATCKMFVETIDTSGFIRWAVVDCYDTPCCLQRFRVCRFGQFIVSVTALGTTISPDDSSYCYAVPDSELTIPPLLPPFTCFADCDSMQIDYTPAKQNKIRLQNMYDKKYHLYFEGDLLIMDCYNNTQCNYKLEIIDLMGKTLYEKQVINTGKRNIIDLRNTYMIKASIYTKYRQTVL